MDDFEAMSEALDNLGNTGAQAVLDSLEEISDRQQRLESMMLELIRSIPGKSRYTRGEDSTAVFYDELRTQFTKKNPFVQIHTA
jgi:hypothetical protein